MRLLKNEDMYARQIRTITSAETSNVAMVVQSNHVFATYYSINADLSLSVAGFGNVHEYIGPHSTVLYDKIENLPMAGVESLVMTSEFDDEMGLDTNFTGQGIIFPNTITPKPGDVFLFPTSIRPAIFIVAGINNVVVRSNPFVEISFRLFTQSTEDVQQLEKQVRDVYKIVVTSIGTDKSLLIKKSTYFEMKDHVSNYLDIADFYTATFYDRHRAAFIYSDIYDSEKDVRTTVIDFMLLKLMYDKGIIVYDPVINFALSNYEMRTDRIYIDRPMLITDHEFKMSIFDRLLTKNHKSPFFEHRYPASYMEDPQLTKFHGANVLYIEAYRNRKNCDPLIGNFTVFDDEFIDRILHDKPYDQYDPRLNATLRNPIISWFNDHELTGDVFEEAYVDGKKTLENFYLIPMVLYLYRQYIASLQ